MGWNNEAKLNEDHRRYIFVAGEIRVVGKRPRSSLLDASTVTYIVVNSGDENTPQKRSGKDVPADAGQNQAEVVENCGGAETGNGGVSVCGRRREMEDAITILPSFSDAGSLHFFGVYDGHGGPHAALRCRERMHRILTVELMAQQPDTTTIEEAQWQRAVVSAFLCMDDEVSGLCSDDDNDAKVPENVGSTAVVAVVGADQIVVANCGDSRVVLSRRGEVIPLSINQPSDGGKLDSFLLFALMLILADWIAFCCYYVWEIINFGHG